MERWLRFGLKQLLRLHLHLQLQLHSPFSFPFPFWLWGVRPFCRATMRAKEIKIENSFISIFWQWLGSASLRKNKINSKQSRENRAANWGKTEPNETYFSCLSLSLSLCICLSLCMCVCCWDCAQLLWNGQENVPSACCWLGLNLLQFPSIAAFYALFLCSTPLPCSLLSSCSVCFHCSVY